MKKRVKGKGRERRLSSFSSLPLHPLLHTITKKSTISTFEHSLVLSKYRTISSTNWKNQHYFETLSALTLKICTSFNHCSEFERWKLSRYLCSKYHVKFEVNSDYECKSRWHFGAGLANCAKRASTLLSIYYLMVIPCNTFSVETSPGPNVADLSTSFNGMNLNKWSCPSSSFGVVFVGFQEH